ncbi:MAG: GNAT family N-acetyltransferase [Candidatus Heimdallarchaeota archaeon]
MVEVIIRRSTENVGEELVDVFVNSFLDEKVDIKRLAIFKRRIDKLSACGLTRYYAATLDDRVIGLGAETRHNGASYIGYIGVVTEHRRKGVATKMFGTILKEASSHNPTVELFSNPGIEDIYRGFGFKDEFQTSIYEISQKKNKTTSTIDDLGKNVPDWVLSLDQQAIGFDRTKLINYLLSFPEAKLLAYEQSGFMICDNININLLIGKSPEVIYILLDNFLTDKPAHLTMPDSQELLLKDYFPNKKKSALKMTYGKPLISKLPYIWCYSGYATG